jgi:hypothetical protein
MSWIAGHRVENSPFWRTAHEVTGALVPDRESPWFSRVAWTNLCPIAPGAYKGNPEGSLRQVQTAAAAEFLGVTVDALRPRLVLVLAGPFIWSFLEPLGLGSLTRSDAPFTLVGKRRDGVPWICGMHPGGAQRRGWPARRYAELIIAQAGRMPTSSAALPVSHANRPDRGDPLIAALDGHAIGCERAPDTCRARHNPLLSSAGRAVRVGCRGQPWPRGRPRQSRSPRGHAATLDSSFRQHPVLRGVAASAGLLTMGGHHPSLRPHGKQHAVPFVASRWGKVAR